MAPTKTNPNRNSHNVLQPVRRSNRIATRFAVMNSNVASGHHKSSSSKRNTETSEILLLNDDCLLAIFSFISLLDLFQLRNSCRRFRALADAEALKQGRREEFHQIYKCKMHEEVVGCYGQFMQNVVFEQNNEVLRLLENGSDAPNAKWKWLKQCTALKCLTLRKIPLEYDRYSAKIYNSLEEFRIDECTNERYHYEMLVGACKNLKTFSVNKLHYPRLIYCVATLENIEKVSIRKCFLYPNHLLKNVAKLWTLKKLKYFELDLRSYPGDLLFTSIIIEFSKIDSLEHLILIVDSIPAGMAEGLDQLKNIKLCKIHYYCRRYIVFDKNEFSDAINAFDVTINSEIGDGCIEYDIKLLRKN